VYQPATFSYRLEVVFKQGDVFGGQNSRRNYRIGFIPLNGQFSVSPSAPWSQNIAETSWQNQPTAGLSTSDAATLGGIVIVASITYDVNNDGMYVPATGTPPGPDEDYQVLLYISPASDCDGDGITDDAEIADGLDTDVNANGIPDSCEGVTGTPFCFGDGTGTACPCANQVPPGTVAGCTSSLGTGGTLLASGNASLSNDTIVLQGSGMPNSSALYFQGTNQQTAGAGVQFGDGKRCAGGAITRLRITTNVGGASQYPFGGNPSVSVKCLVTVPGIRTYQVWYRNAAAFCTPATFNLSNGLQLTWVP
jgi:hypothetical protein